MSRVVHGSGRVGFGLNPDSTAGVGWRGRGTRNQPPEKSVKSVLGEGDRRSVQSVAGVKNISKSKKKKVARI